MNNFAYHIAHASNCLSPAISRCQLARTRLMASATLSPRRSARVWSTSLIWRGMPTSPVSQRSPSGPSVSVKIRSSGVCWASAWMLVAWSVSTPKVTVARNQGVERIARAGVPVDDRPPHAVAVEQCHNIVLGAFGV